MLQDCTLAIPQPNRMTEILRSSDDDNSRSAVIDQLCAKYGLGGRRRRFIGQGGTPRHIAVSVAHHGVTSVTFFHLGGRS